MSSSSTQAAAGIDQAALLSRASALLQEALKQGADEAQVISRGAEETKVRYEKNDFTCTSTNETLTLSLKVYKNGKKGTASTNDLDEGALADTAGRALSLAGFSIEDKFLKLPEDSDITEVAGRFDPELAAIGTEELHRLAAEFIAAARSDERISLDGGQVEVTKYYEAIVNSNGLSRTDAITRLDWTVMGLGKTETETTSFDYMSDSSWSWKGAAEKAEATASKLVASILSSFGPKSCESYKGHIVLAPAVVSDLLISPIRYQVSGSALMDGKSRWDKSLGEVVAASSFTLQDSAHNTELMGATPYDAEGVATKPLTVIENGVLRAHLDSTYTASHRGTQSTGHANGMHTIEISGGDATRDELLRSADQVILVERFSGNVDPLTGDFSGIAKGSHFYKNGEYQHALTETMIAGNVFELLKDIKALSKDPKPHCGQYVAPWILVDGVSVTGA